MRRVIAFITGLIGTVLMALGSVIEYIRDKKRRRKK